MFMSKLVQGVALSLVLVSIPVTPAKAEFGLGGMGMGGGFYNFHAGFGGMGFGMGGFGMGMGGFGGGFSFRSAALF